MKIIRYKDQKNETFTGWMYADKVGPIEGDIFASYQRGEANLPLEDVTLLPPVVPGKIVCVGRNYSAHAKEHGAEVPEIPLLFLKPPSSILSPGGTIILPPQSSAVEHEAELAVVIGKKARWVSTETASQSILGYTNANDVTARDLQRKDNQWTRAKGFDTFCPFGPFIETDYDPTDVLITCHVNEGLRQMASTHDMVFPINNLIAYISSIMTLMPGDLILTGTPSGVNSLLPGDEVKISIEGLGALINNVAKPSGIH